MSSSGRAITVYCSSSNRLDPEFYDMAQAVGESIARRGLTLVYGGGGVGLMGAVAKAAKSAGARVEGIITTYLLGREQGWDECDELVVVETMRERKRVLEERGDAFLVLPGGLGTYEEFFEILVGRQLNAHQKPIGVVNAHGYFNPLVAMIEHAIEHRFVADDACTLFEINPDADVVIDHLMPTAG